MRNVLWLWLLLAGAGWAQVPSGESPARPLNSDTAAVLQQAFDQMQAGRMAEARELLKAGLEASPNVPQLLDMLGTLYFKMGELDHAEEAYLRMSETPLRSTALFNLGEVRMLRKDFARGGEAFEKFLKTPGNKLNALARMKLYICLLKSGDGKGAAVLEGQVQPTISHPLYYMVRAAKAFHGGRAQEGEEFILAAQEIYGTPMVAAFAQTFVDQGWMRRDQVPEVGQLSEAQLRTLNREFQPAPVSMEIEKRGLLERSSEAPARKK